MDKQTKNGFIVIILFVIAISLFSVWANNQMRTIDNVPIVGVNDRTPTAQTATANDTQQLYQLQIQLAELQNKLTSMQNQIDNVQTRTELVGLDKLQSSNKSLIPRIPFRIEVRFAEFQSPLTYTFKHSHEVYIRDRWGEELAHYTTDPKKNTILIDSKKYNMYGLHIFKNNIASIYDTGWIGWISSDYTVTPPKYNPMTQQYELN